MQNKGAIRLFAILLAVVSLYQLSFTFFTKRTEKAAKEFAKGDHEKEFAYLDSIANEPVYNFLFLKKYTYMECKGNEINFGLDLKGGMNLILEVKVADIIKALSNHNNNPVFLEAIKRAEAKEKSTTKDFISLFAEEFEAIDPQAQLATIFNTVELKELVKYNSSNKEVIEVLRTESEGAISNAFNILRTRIDRFGVTQPNIQRLEKAGRVLVELPGVTDPQRVRKLLQGTASLEFWETYNNSELIQYLMDADAKSRLLVSGQVEVAQTADSVVAPKTEGDLALLNQISGDSIAKPTDAKSLFSYLMAMPGGYGPVVGTAVAKDTADVNAIINNESIKSVLPRDLKLMWTVKPLQGKDAQGWVNRPINPKESVFQLVAIKVTSLDKRAPLEGDVITNARHNVGSRGSDYEVSMTMNSEGAKTWARLTKANLNRSIAIVLDGFVYSFPTVQSEISGGSSQITGNFTPEEAQDLANILKSGKLPAPARIVEDTVVGPSLGQEAIDSGFSSFLWALLAVFLFMVFFYGAKVGLIADFALLANLFFIMGVLASFGAVLTLPGIAGIVLTIGMAVDANVIIYERIKEELRVGKSVSMAVADGYSNALSAILDGNITTLLTAVILFFFGTGPIKGFATTLMIGILCSLFAAIFISRLIIEWMLQRKQKIEFTTSLTKNFMQNVHIKFLEKRKYAYIFSSVLMVICLGSLATRGLKQGIDFTGGQLFVVRFDQPVSSVEVQQALLKELNGATVEVKTFGQNNQVRIATNFMVEESNEQAQFITEEKLYNGLKPFIKADVDKEEFLSDYRMSSQKVGPTIASDIKEKAVYAIFFSFIVMFLYIFIRFRKVEYGLSSVLALIHDVIFVLGCYSLFYSVMPFSMEIDQAFIAAILTVIGYSINDTVIIFDRIREYLLGHPKQEKTTTFNSALNSTLGRTLNTSFTTLLTLLIIFVFGGEVIRGFVFAMIIGIVVGTYSSLFVATPLAFDVMMRKERKAAALNK
ncbi:MAG: protein translocase subunit SecDF [Breznakibacter sp.]|nr:protein translocase subunit SecDF [Breznakibacter sp.]